MIKIKKRPTVVIEENHKIIYQKHTWLFFNWYTVIRADRLYDDLYIIADRPFAHIYLQDKPDSAFVELKVNLEDNETIK